MSFKKEFGGKVKLKYIINFITKDFNFKNEGRYFLKEYHGSYRRGHWVYFPISKIIDFWGDTLNYKHGNDSKRQGGNHDYVDVEFKDEFWLMNYHVVNYVLANKKEFDLTEEDLEKLVESLKFCNLYRNMKLVQTL